VRVRALRAIAAFGLLAAAASTTLAAPLVTVRSHTHLELDEGRRVGGELFLRGRLIDDATGAGIANQYLSLVVEGTDGTPPVERRPYTDNHGSFEEHIPLPLGSYSVVLDFPGTDVYGQAPSLPTTLDLSKGTLHLSLATPQSVDTTQGQLTLTAAAAEDGDPRDVSVDVFEMDDGSPNGDGSGAGRLLTSIITGGHGQGSAHVPVSQLGGAGRHTLKAVFSGSSDLNPASAETFIVVYVQAGITLQAASTSVSASDRLSLFGAVRSATGPLSQAPITLVVEGRPAAVTLSADDGTFQFDVAAADLPGGQVDFTARYDSGVDSVASAVSQPVTVTILPPRPFPTRWVIAPIALTILAGAAFLLARRLRSRGDRLALAVHPPKPGLITAPRTLRQVFASTPRNDIDGTFWDAAFARPIGGGRLTLAGAGQSVEAVAAFDGRFSLGPLPPGEWVGHASAPGYLPVPVRLALPHRGTLTGARLVLVPIRALLLDTFKDASHRYLERPVAAGALTDREVYAAAAPRAGGERAAPLRSLLDLLEESYYSGRPAPIESLEHAQHLAARAAPSRPPDVG
jgi:hypothetical protein